MPDDTPGFRWYLVPLRHDVVVSLAFSGLCVGTILFRDRGWWSGVKFCLWMYFCFSMIGRWWLLSHAMQSGKTDFAVLNRVNWPLMIYGLVAFVLYGYLELRSL